METDSSDSLSGASEDKGGADVSQLGRDSSRSGKASAAVPRGAGLVFDTRLRASGGGRLLLKLPLAQIEAETRAQIS